MLKYSIIIIVIALSISNLVFGQNSKPSSSKNETIIDSIFMSNFSRMESCLKEVKPQGDGSLDRVFIYLVTLLSGIDCTTTDYTGFPYYDRNKLDQWEKWYKINHKKINLDDYLKGYKIISNQVIHSEDERKILDNLRIK